MTTKKIGFPVCIEGIGEVQSWTHLKAIARGLGLSNGFIASSEDLVGAVADFASKTRRTVPHPPG